MSDDLNICNMPGQGNIAAGTITVSGAQSAQSLTFGAQTYQSVGMALVGGTVTLGGTGVINVLTSGTPATVITTTLAGTAGLTKTGSNARRPRRPEHVHWRHVDGRRDDAGLLQRRGGP